MEYERVVGSLSTYNRDVKYIIYAMRELQDKKPIILPVIPVYSPQELDYFYVMSYLYLRVPEFEDVFNVINGSVYLYPFYQSFLKLFKIACFHSPDIVKIFYFGCYKVYNFCQLLFYKLRVAAFYTYREQTVRQLYSEALCNDGIASVLCATYAFKPELVQNLYLSEYVPIMQKFLRNCFPYSKLYKSRSFCTATTRDYVFLEYKAALSRELQFGKIDIERVSNHMLYKLTKQNMHRNEFFNYLNNYYKEVYIAPVYVHFCYFDFNFQVQRRQFYTLLNSGNIYVIVQKIYLEKCHFLHNDCSEVDLVQLLIKFLNLLIFESDLFESTFEDLNFIAYIIKNEFYDIFNEAVCSELLHAEKTLPGLLLLGLIIYKVTLLCSFKNAATVNIYKSLKAFITNQIVKFLQKIQNEEMSAIQIQYDLQCYKLKLLHYNLPRARLLYLSGALFCLVEVNQYGLDEISEEMMVFGQYVVEYISTCESPIRRLNEINCVLNLVGEITFPRDEILQVEGLLKEIYKLAEDYVAESLGLSSIDNLERKKLLVDSGVIGSLEREHLLSRVPTQ